MYTCSTCADRYDNDLKMQRARPRKTSFSQRSTNDMEYQTGRLLCSLWAVLYASVIFPLVDLSIFIPVILLLCLILSAIYNDTGLTPAGFIVFVLITFSGTALVFVVRWICIEAYCFSFECCRASWIPANLTGKCYHVIHGTIFILV